MKATEKKLPEVLIFQWPQYKRGIIVGDTEVVYNAGGFLSVGQRPLPRRGHDDITV